MSMIRISLVIWLIVVGGVAFGLYQVKYEVQHMEEELSQVRQEIERERNALHVLEAEWSYLNRPQYLARMARKHLQMAPAEPRQVATVPRIPPRILRNASAQADQPKFDGIPVPTAKPWSLEPRDERTAPSQAPQRAETRMASAEPRDSGREATRPAATQPGEPARREAQVAQAEAQTISVGHIKISLGGAQ